MGGKTTGGITISVARKWPAHSERELAAAEVSVEGTATREEDIDDEAWGTSEATEYEEEIFQHMKELEVRKLRTRLPKA